MLRLRGGLPFRFEQGLLGQRRLADGGCGVRTLGEIRLSRACTQHT